MANTTDAPLDTSTSPDATGATAGGPADTSTNAVAGAVDVGGAPATLNGPPDTQTLTSETQVADNPYGLTQLWQQGDMVAKGVLIILLIMSLVTWYFLLTKLYDQAKIFRQSKTAAKRFWTASSLEGGAESLEKDSAFRGIITTGLASLKQHDPTLIDQIDTGERVSLAVQRSVEFVYGRLQTGISFLATVGSTAPFVGLFGTVWGIYHALIAIALAGQPSIDKVAGPVGEALIMTAIGLGVAVPAVWGYNWLVRRNKLANEQLRNFATNVQAILLAEAPSADVKALRAAAR